MFREMIIKIETKIEEVLKKVRPYIQMHGGDVALVKVNKGTVTLGISGACTHCGLADLTYNKVIGGILKEEIPIIKSVKLIFNKKQNGKSKRVRS
jgi:Fe-S cluster biogenesis protein NfuA